MSSFILVKGLSKSFGQVTAVDGIDLEIAAGEIYGLVGSDGAGKTTTLRLLVGALRLERGSISIGGVDVLSEPEKARSLTGYLSQRFSLYEDLTVLENIRFFAELRGLKPEEWRPRCLEILDFVGLAGFRDRRAGQLSGGMKQKLGLASALVTHPRLLLLDEPTTGVDPVTRQDFWQLILRITRQEDTTVILTTPYMDEATRCHRVGFMKVGQIIVEGTPRQLRDRLAGRIVEVISPNPLPLRDRLRSITGVEDARVFGDRLHLRVAAAGATTIINILNNPTLSGLDPSARARLISPSLEDVFIAATGTQTGIDT